MAIHRHDGLDVCIARSRRHADGDRFGANGDTAHGGLQMDRREDLPRARPQRTADVMPPLLKAQRDDPPRCFDQSPVILG